MPLGIGSGAGVLAALLVFAGIALAALGLQNPSFESGLDNWVVKTDRGSSSNRTVVYGEGGKKGEPVPCDDKPYGICVVGTDSFDFVDNGDWENIESATVTPVDGDSMLRLGGPYGHGDLPQLEDRFVAQQTFTVDPANPILQMNYNVFTYDYTGFDEFEFKVTLTDEDGVVVARESQGSFGTGTDLKTTGWQPNQIDLSDYAGEQLSLTLASGGTSDPLYPFWTYVDAGLVAAPPASGEDSSAEVPTLPGGGAVNLNQHVDPSTGQSFFTAPASQASQFPGGCMPLTLDVPINAGGGSVSNVNLLFEGAAIPMSAVGGGVWRATIDCVENGSLAVEFDLTEGSVTQHFVVPLGGIVLIDPQGVVYDESDYDAAVANGMTPEEARADAAISGATVRLQRQTEGTFVNVLSGDPGISPNVNPQITSTDGLYQWDVSAGTYRVVVAKSGYVGVTSASVVIPPPVLDLHIPMEEYQTAITSGPNGSTADTTPTFGFSANDPAGSTFECRIDSAAFAPCSGAAGHTPAALSPGNHTFAVRGTDSTGYVDPTPATRAFTVTAAQNGCATARQALATAQARFDAASQAAEDAQAKAKQAQAKAKKAKAKAKKSDSPSADKKAKKAKAKAKNAKAEAAAAEEDADNAETGLAQAQAQVDAACG